MMRERELFYVTQEGYIYLDDCEHGVFLYVEDGDNPTETATRSGADFTRTDLKVLFAWITLPPDQFGGSQGSIAEIAQVSNSSVTRALDKLAAAGYPRHREYLLGEQLLNIIQYWAEAYSTKVKPKLRAQRFKLIGAPKDWRSLPELLPGFAYSGIAAAAIEKFVLVASQEREVYGNLVEALTFFGQLRWVPDPKGEIICYERFWKSVGVEWRLTGRSDHETIPLLTYADLLSTGDVRAIDVAERDVINLCLRLYERKA